MKNKHFIRILSPEIEVILHKNQLLERIIEKNHAAHGVSPHPNRANVLAELIEHDLVSF